MYDSSHAKNNLPLKVRIAANGRIVIPAEVRQELGLQEGDELLLSQEKDGIRLTTFKQALRGIRELVAQYATPGVSQVEELSRERREEAAEEERELREWTERQTGR